MYTRFGHDFVEDEKGHPSILLSQAEAYTMRQAHAGRIEIVGGRYAYTNDAASDADDLAAITDRTLAEITA